MWQDIFLAKGQVRPIWRFFLSAVLIFLAMVAVNLALGVAFGMLGHHPGFLVALSLSSLMLFPLVLGIFKGLTAVFERKPLGSVGLAFSHGWNHEFGLGLILGTVAILFVAGVEVLLGLGEFHWGSGASGRVLPFGLVVAVMLLVAAANEELVFRGYPFQRLVEATGPVGAVALTSAFFGLVHLGNPSSSSVSTLNTMLVGIPLAVAYLRTRMLWLPVGIHFSWNFVQGFVLGLPVSGFSLPETALQGQVRGATWLTGGNYGPEGGLLASAAILALSLYLFFSKSIYIKEETKRLVFGFTPSTGGPETLDLSATSLLQPKADPPERN